MKTLYVPLSTHLPPTNKLTTHHKIINHPLTTIRITTSHLLALHPPQTITKPPTPKHPHKVTLHTTLPTTFCLFTTLLPTTLRTTTLLNTALPTTNLLTTKLSTNNHLSTTLQPITQLSTTTLLTHSYSEHHSPNHPIVDHHSHNHKSLDHCSPNHHSQTPTAHASHQAKHPSPADHPIVDHLIPAQSESPLVSSTRHAPDQHTPAPQTPDHITTPHITTNQQPLEHKSSDLISPTHPSPVHVSTPSSPPTHKPPVDAFNVTQGSHSQNFAQIATLPLFDATPLGKPTSPEVMSGSDPGTCYAPYKPAGTSTPNSTPTKPAVSPQAFSPHCSSPNAFAALKGSTKSFMSSPNRETAKDGKKEEVDKEDTYSGSPDTKVRKIVAEVNVQTAEDEVCELSDSATGQKNRAHSLSAEEIALHKALNRIRFPTKSSHHISTVDLWSLFSKTLKSARNV
ncbi:unnamed protein product [Brassica napus]|uniref:(rape) hypothetical protein n=1 Tax=Brassica napus TaxID=3708 RepID=A0A816IG81_BRANA|nr:unnamed protein product [Brassica napus]